MRVFLFPFLSLCALASAASSAGPKFDGRRPRFPPLSSAAAAASIFLPPSLRDYVIAEDRQASSSFLFLPLPPLFFLPLVVAWDRYVSRKHKPRQIEEEAAARSGRRLRWLGD